LWILLVVFVGVVLVDVRVLGEFQVVFGDAGLLALLEADRVVRLAEHRLDDLGDGADFAVELAVLVVQDDFVVFLEAHDVCFPRSPQKRPDSRLRNRNVRAAVIAAYDYRSLRHSIDAEPSAARHGMPVDELWYLADCAAERAERAYHDLTAAHEDYVEFERRRSVSRDRFRTLAQRVERHGAPYGAHTAVYRENGDLLLVRHEAIEQWVLPGGGIESGETFHEAAVRELAEEAGVDAEYDGLAMVTRVRFQCNDHEAWGVMPVFGARAAETTLDVSDPDGEITDARWFDALPEDTRDRGHLREWRQRTQSVTGT
jgi:8-oxo-dGTP diphosphatase